MRLLQELNRRNVIRVAILYAAISWLLIQISDVLSSILNLPAWAGVLVVMLLALGFIPVLIFSWIFEFTPEGLKREENVDRPLSIRQQTARRLDVMIIVLLGIAIASVWIDHYLSQDPSITVTLEDADLDGSSNTEKTIAVLPFVNMSEDPGNEYFADGVSEEILNLLARLPGLRVTSRSSAFSFKGQNVNIPTIAAKLDVAHVLEGSVRKSGDQLRITAQLIEVDTDTHLWSETYDREIGNIFVVQDEIAAAVVTELEIRLLGEPPKKQRTQPDAYSLFLKARQLLNQRSYENLTSAEDLLNQALEIDPDFASAWTSLANVYAEQTGYYLSRSIDEGRDLSRNAIERALDADPNYGPAHSELAAFNLEYNFDFDAAELHIAQALELTPSDARTLQIASGLELAVGNVDEAVSFGQRAVAVDPLSYWSHSMLGWTYFRSGRMSDAEDSYRHAMSLLPAGSDEPGWIFEARVLQGDVEAALAVANRSGKAMRLYFDAIVQHALGKTAKAETALDELADHYAERMEYQVAATHAYHGDHDAAFEWLDRALDQRDPMLIWVLTDPFLAGLHADRRWEDFLDRMGLPH